MRAPSLRRALPTLPTLPALPGPLVRSLAARC